MPTILSYINESEKYCLEIIKERKRITEKFIHIVKSEDIKEVILIGSGTSCHAAMIVKPFLEDICKVNVTAMFPMVFMDQVKNFRPGTLVIGLSQSGTSSSTIQALIYAKKNHIKTVSLSSEFQSDITLISDTNVLIMCGNEKAVAKTKGYHATIVTLYVCALEWALSLGLIESELYNEYIERLTKVIKNFTTVINQSEIWYNAIKDDLMDAKSFMIIGAEHQLGNVMEAALKLVETVRIPGAGYELEEFMHGIYNAISSDTYIFYFAQPSKYLDRLIKLKNYLLRKTSHQYSIIQSSSVFKTNTDCSIDFVEDSYFSGLEYIIPFQILCHYLPGQFGIDPFISGDPMFHSIMQSKIV